jgi:CheY-like chemotaxis protein
MMPRTIFIVDDDPDDVFLLDLALKEKGYNVVFSLNPEEALLRARQIKPDLIILDILMPRLDGSEVAARLKENASTKNIPILFLTALKTPQDQIQPMGSQANLVLAKPFDESEVVNAVKMLLHEEEDVHEPWNENVKGF